MIVGFTTVVAVWARLLWATFDYRLFVLVEALVYVEVVDGVEEVGTLFVRWMGRGAWATLMCSVANCIVYVNYSPTGTRSLCLHSRIPK